MTVSASYKESVLNDINGKFRPEWKGHDDDFPHGGRPTDIITKDRREQIQSDDFDWIEIKNVIPANE